MSIDSAPEVRDNGQQSLATAAARNLATTTKSVPRMQGISSRWLQKMLPWAQAGGGAYRVNRRLPYTIGDGRIDFDQSGSEVATGIEEPFLTAYSEGSFHCALIAADRV